jgi:malate dehydrogenase (oxaloacetate-decarboxylating)
LTRAMVQTMNKEPIIFALSNPVPEILPSEIADIAGIIATGRSDYANQVNNVLCFPGIFRGALDSGAKKITMGMKIAAAQGIADCVAQNELSRAHIIPTVFHENVAEVVARAVAEEAIREGITAPERQGPRLLVGAHERA